MEVYISYGLWSHSFHQDGYGAEETVHHGSFTNVHLEGVKSEDERLVRCKLLVRSMTMLVFVTKNLQRSAEKGVKITCRDCCEEKATFIIQGKV